MNVRSPHIKVKGEDSLKILMPAFFPLLGELAPPTTLVQIFSIVIRLL